MKSTRRAVIDVGTNSVKLLIGDVAGQAVTPVDEDSKQTRLGAGFYESHRLQPAAITQTAEAVAKFSARAKEAKATSVRVIATSAARDAVNGNDLVEAIRQSSGLALEIISGEQEADWAFHGVTSDPAFAALPLVILDLGGGSSEFIVGENSVPRFSKSYRMGTVRLMEQLQLADLPGQAALESCRTNLRRFLEKEVAPELNPALQTCKQPPHLVGTGGTATILARMEGKMNDFNRERIEAARLSAERICALSELLWNLSHADRQKIVGLPPKRADVILAGVVIYEAVMERFSLGELRVSTRGLRFAALMDSAS